MKHLIITICLFFTLLCVPNLHTATRALSVEEDLMFELFCDLLHYYPNCMQEMISTRTDSRKLKAIALRYVINYGKIHAETCLARIARERMGLRTDQEINKFVRDTKELMKALLPEKMLEWVRIILMAQTHQRHHKST